MSEQPVPLPHGASARHAGNTGRPRSLADAPISLTLRVRDCADAPARTCIERLLRGIPGLRIMTVSQHRGTATLALLAPRHAVDAMLHLIMVELPGAELGPLLPAGLAAVH
ncbi:hypothetical protein [Bordetella genomosp. 11]|uniref:Uncharacterized protein n=1 Tax=Bordetella genomosp. 11 TaxID=1416808 RepID=A0A261UJA0_9BORD|nr:hypothetical protein [Bordetella genomosp. 11]OZI61984.1 hypothetical protein CAL28_22390 [Bordetella genomosp. 11]